MIALFYCFIVYAVFVLVAAPLVGLWLKRQSYLRDLTPEQMAILNALTEGQPK